MTDLDRQLITLAEERAPGAREKIDGGEWLIEPGRDPLAPVLRDAKTKRLVKGSGQMARANSPDAMNRAQAAGEYRGKFYELIPPDATPEVRHSFETLFDDLYDAAMGSPQMVECPHEGCHKRHAFAFKRDAGVLYKILENLVGPGLKTEESHKTETRLEVLIQLREQPVSLVMVDSETVMATKQRAIDEGVIEASWYLVEDDPDPD